MAKKSHSMAANSGKSRGTVNSASVKDGYATKKRMAQESDDEVAYDHDGSSGEEEEFEEGSSQHHGLDDDGSEGEEEFEEEEEPDPDAPRVAQWEDDDDELLYEKEEEEEENEERGAISEKALKQNLQELPLGALRRAQRVLSQAQPDSDSDSGDSESNSESEDEPEAHSSKGKGKEKVEKVEWSAKPRTDIAKRANKHAPIEVTSKKPVTRRRTVVEVPKIVPRDPRFLPTAGEFAPDKFSKSYAFLAESHKKELATLRESLKQARKMLSSSPRDQREEREHEVYRLEQAVKRAESLVNRDKMEQVQREALSKVKKEEQQKRSQGKGEWYLKKGEKQKLVMQARYEALAKEGGQRAVKKAIEKRQKKESQKEKRSRPYAKGEDGMSRKRTSDSGWPNAKRQRV
ncbi:DUF947-domain-containing protein [Agrocybe pediades]|nr:DUF947-domain-containing protein [Agrocybe pediades]